MNVVYFPDTLAGHDHLGSIPRLRWFGTSSFGSDEFDPYGGVYATTGYIDNFDNLRHFALHPEDPALQAYRVYSPAMARWTTRDPLGMVDGPNMYGYVGGNPIFFVDLFGTKEIFIGTPTWWSTHAWGAGCVACAVGLLGIEGINYAYGNNMDEALCTELDKNWALKSACAACAGIITISSWFIPFLPSHTDILKWALGINCNCK